MAAEGAEAAGTGAAEGAGAARGVPAGRAELQLPETVQGSLGVVGPNREPRRKTSGYQTRACGHDGAEPRASPQSLAPEPGAGQGVLI